MAGSSVKGFVAAEPEPKLLESFSVDRSINSMDCGSSATGGTVLRRDGPPIGGVGKGVEAPEAARARVEVWTERIDEAMFPVAAKKPSGGSDCSKL